MKPYIPFLVLVAGLVAATSMSVTGKPAKTTRDLEQAYLAESSSQIRFAGCARQAEREGYPAVSTLFRAVADADSVEAANHLQALQDLGADSAALASAPQSTSSTRQNLAEAVREETAKYTTLYPHMIADSRLEDQANAEISFAYARHAQKQHAALFAAALTGLSRSMPAQTYYVSSRCGGVYAGEPPAICPICGLPGSKFTVFRTIPGSAAKTARSATGGQSSARA